MELKKKLKNKLKKKPSGVTIYHLPFAIRNDTGRENERSGKFIRKSFANGKYLKWMCCIQQPPRKKNGRMTSREETAKDKRIYIASSCCDRLVAST